MKKLQLVVVLLMAVLLTSNAVAGAYWSGGVSGSWNDTWTWGNATNYPVAGDFAYMNVGSTISIDGSAEAAQELHLASWSGTSDLVSLNLINGGSLDIAGVTHVGVADGDFGLLSVGTGSTFTANSALNVGYNGNGTLELNGGTVNASGGLYVSNPWSGTTGVGTVSLLDGTLNVGDFAMSSTGLIDIEAGIFSIYGLWWDATLNGLISSNQIVGYGGTQAVTLDHVGDYTVLTAVPEPMTLSLLGLGMLGLVRRKK